MDRAFQFSLRAALALVILAGVGLVAYSIAAPGPSYHRTANVPAAPPAQAAAPAPGQQPAAVPAQAAPTAPAVGGTQPAAAPPNAAPSNSSMSLSDWRTDINDTQTQRQQGVISGREAVVRNDNTVDVIQPLLQVLAPEELNADLGSVHVTAQQGSVDKDKGLVRLFTAVKAEGRDFTVEADHVLYSFSDRTLTSDSPVKMVRFNLAPDGTKTPAMTLNGQGMDADMNLETMRIRSHPVAHILKVAKDFLAAGPQAGSLPVEPADVTITSDGPMTYDHRSQTVTFAKTVKAIYGARTLTCDELTVKLQPVPGKQAEMAVSDINAVGDVTLSYEDQTARGQKLEWHSVTSSATLEGDACVVTSPQFVILGRTLVLYQIRSRFDVKGPGTLYWGQAARASAPVPGAAPAASAAAPYPERPAAAAPTAVLTSAAARAAGARAVEAAAPVGILKIGKDNNVTVTWQKSMSYDTLNNYAAFSGGVQANQTDSALKCDDLRINFRSGSSQIDNVVADGNVTVRDASATNGRDILCQKMTYNAQTDTVELTAAKGQTVTITQGAQTISSSHLVLDNHQGALDCPAPGSLTLQPTRQQPAGAAPAEPVTVDWQVAMHFVHHPLPVATFSGAVVARRADESLKADHVRIDFDANMDPQKITAQDGASIDVSSSSNLFAGSAGSPAAPAGPAALAPDNRWRLTGDTLTIEPASQTIWTDTPGTLSVVQKGAPAGTIAWKKQMRLDSVKSEAHFVGSVGADMPGGALKCDDLTMTFDETHQLRHARAEGGVTFDSTDQKPWTLTSSVADAVFGPNSSLSQFIARGDSTLPVSVTDKTSTVTSRRLTLYLDQPPGQSSVSVSRAVAEEAVTVTYNEDPPVRGTGDKLEWDRTTDNYTLTGDPRARVIRGDLPFSAPTIVLSRPTGGSVGMPLP